MSIKRLSKILFLPLSLSFILSSCFFDTKPLGFCVKNCTKDTLLIDLTESDTLNDEMYWGIHIKDTIGLVPEDTTTVHIHGRKVIISNFYYVLPNSISKGIYPLNNDTCYVYAIKWRVATHYSLEEIRARKLYDRQTVTKKDFNHNRLFEYKRADSSRRH